MILSEFLAAIGLIFVLEGILPFLSPRIYRKVVDALAKHKDRSIRIFGFISMLVGLFIVYLVHIGIIQ